MTQEFKGATDTASSTTMMKTRSSHLSSLSWWAGLHSLESMKNVGPKLGNLAGVSIVYPYSEPPGNT